jgi:hypothetical protein
VAAGEDQAESILAAARRISVEQGQLLLEPLAAPGVVDRLPPCGGQQPGAGAIRNAGSRPCLERDDERLLNELFGKVEVAEEADQRRGEPARLFPEGAVEGLTGANRRRRRSGRRA